MSDSEDYQSEWIVVKKGKKKTNCENQAKSVIDESINQYNKHLECLSSIDLKSRLNCLNYLTTNSLYVENQILPRDTPQRNRQDIILRQIDSKSLIKKINNIEVYSLNQSNIQTCISFSRNFNKNLKYNELDEQIIEIKKQQWQSVQNELKRFVSQNDDPILSDDFKSLKYIGGMDVSFHKDANLSVACAGIVIYEINSNKTLKLIYQHCHYTNLDIPFVTSFLVFREYNSYNDLFSLIPKNIFPQLICFDGNGLFHENKFGMACHIGVLNNLISIGISKTYSYITQNTFQTQPKFKEDSDLSDFAALNLKPQEAWPITTSKNECLGYLFLNSTQNTPVFVSSGNKISNETSLKFVKYLATLHAQSNLKYSKEITSIPLLTHHADKLTRKALNDLEHNLKLF